MSNYSYSQIVGIITHYLFRYPSVPVAIECAIEDINEGDCPIIREGLAECLKRINDGENEAQVLSEFADKIGSLEFKEFADKIADGTAKKKDIGFYVKGIDPVEYFKERNYQQKKKKPYRRR
jgi:hypothetical protein